MSTRSQPGWEASGTFEVAPGVHRIPLPLPGDGLRAVNVYAIEDGDKLALVDTGSFRAESQTALDAGLAALDAGIGDISVVLATHAHYDHYGLASKIRGTAGAEVVLGEHDNQLLNVAVVPEQFELWVEHRRRWLTRHGAATLLPAMDRFERHQQLEASREDGRWESPDRLVSDGEQIELHGRTLTVRWTPGHTRGHIVYHDPEHGLLFAGDHVLPHITPSLGFEPFTDGRALEMFLQSMAAVRELPANLVLPGHGPVFNDLPGRVDELVAHHKRRLATCVEVISADGECSARAVASRLSWTRHERAFSDLDPFNRMLAVTETITHLELLVEKGCLRHHENGQQTLEYALAA